MFNRIVRFIRNVRIKIDYPRYEKQCRLEHEQVSERLYSNQGLKVELSNLTSKIQGQADSLFNEDIFKIQARISQLKTNISKNENILGYFTRHYKQEIDALYEKKNTLFSEKESVYKSKNELSSELSVVFERKNTAYETLNHYKSCVDSWYAKSSRTPWLLGKSGKKIPKHSLFGQSHGDLNSYKYHRDKAYDDVQGCKNEIGRLKKKQHQLNDRIIEIKRVIGTLTHEIHKVKADRTRMYKFKKEGHNKHKLQYTLREIDGDLKNEQSKESDLQAKRNEYVTAEKQRLGVIELENKIKEIQKRKTVYIKEFDTDGNHKKRIKKHRLEWLKKRKLE